MSVDENLAVLRGRPLVSLVSARGPAALARRGPLRASGPNAVPSGSMGDGADRHAARLRSDGARSRPAWCAGATPIRLRLQQGTASIGSAAVGGREAPASRCALSDCEKKLRPPEPVHPWSRGPQPRPTPPIRPKASGRDSACSSWPACPGAPRL